MGRLSVVGAVLVAAAIVQVAAPIEAQRTSFSIVEATIAETRDALEQGRVTSRDIVAQSLMQMLGWGIAVCSSLPSGSAR